MIGEIADAVASGFKWLTGRNAAKNAAPVVAAQTAQNEVNAKAKTSEAIKKHDTDEMRKEWAE